VNYEQLVPLAEALGEPAGRPKKALFLAVFLLILCFLSLFVPNKTPFSPASQMGPGLDGTRL